MFEITNTPRPYAWGSTTALAKIRGETPTGKPEAELWFGDYPACPAIRVADGLTLVRWEVDNGREPLPFLLKLLAVASPLSIQVHPSLAAARTGFERENAAGIPLDNPARNYKDDNHKPEIIRAVTEFSALSGFRPHAERIDIIDALVDADVEGAKELAATHTVGLRSVVEAIVRHEEFAQNLADGIGQARDITNVPAHVVDAIDTARHVASTFPGDPGAVLALLLNHIVLAPGEALAVPAGTVHAYLSGVGVEVMASSDNVLRGGCTAKHVDAGEFLSVVDWREGAIELVVPITGPGARRLRADFDDCELVDIEVNGETVLGNDGPAIALVLNGEIEIEAGESVSLTPGRAAYIDATDKVVTLRGSGNVIVARAARPAL